MINTRKSRRISFEELKKGRKQYNFNPRHINRAAIPVNSSDGLNEVDYFMYSRYKAPPTSRQGLVQEILSAITGFNADFCRNEKYFSAAVYIVANRAGLITEAEGWVTIYEGRRKVK
jgi:hypothetical protein